MTDDVERGLEATLFASEEPLTVEAMAAHLGGLEKPVVRDALKALQAHYADRGLHLVERGKRWHFETAPDLAH
ncbi:MAG: SMC-Scp complex subunit ScpB, partial [Marivita sp.]|uniref:SMC-Scp complex subunit ScpB n=1 Tax=Marivita sp. TaxID=2003365 RepID=UPI003EF216DB